MLLALEIGMLVFGIVTLAQGKITFSRTKVVEGAPAYITGVILLLPLPLAFMVGIMVGLEAAQKGRQIDPLDSKFILIEGGIILACFLVVMFICAACSSEPRRSRRDEEDEWGDVDRDRHRPRDRYDDDDDDGWDRRRPGPYRDDESYRPRERDDRDPYR
jgi:hypothetical protein